MAVFRLIYSVYIYMYIYKRKFFLRVVNIIIIITEMMNVNNAASKVWTGARGGAVG
jgi:hypothetical protein